MSDCRAQAREPIYQKASAAMRPRSTRETTSSSDTAEMYVATLLADAVSNQPKHRLREIYWRQASTRLTNMCRGQQASGNVTGESCPHLPTGFGGIFFRDAYIQVFPQPAKASSHAFGPFFPSETLKTLPFVLSRQIAQSLQNLLLYAHKRPSAIM